MNRNSKPHSLLPLFPQATKTTYSLCSTFSTSLSNHKRKSDSPYPLQKKHPRSSKLCLICNVGFFVFPLLWLMNVTSRGIKSKQKYGRGTCKILDRGEKECGNTTKHQKEIQTNKEFLHYNDQTQNQVEHNSAFIRTNYCDEPLCLWIVMSYISINKSEDYVPLAWNKKGRKSPYFFGSLLDQMKLCVMNFFL